MVPEYLNNNEIPVVLPMQYPSQVCRLGMLFHWTRECEQGIGEVRYDRKALQALLKKYTTNTGRLSSILARGSWRTLDEPMLPFHKARLECMITVRVAVPLLPVLVCTGYRILCSSRCGKLQRQLAQKKHLKAIITNK